MYKLYVTCDTLVTWLVTCNLTCNLRVVEFMYLIFTCMPCESYRRRLWSLVLCMCYMFCMLINSLVCGFWCNWDVLYGQCEQMHFVQVFTVISGLLSYTCNFISVLLVNWETRVDDAFVLKECREGDITQSLLRWPANSQWTPDSDLFFPFIFWTLVVCLPTPFYVPSHV